MKPLILWTIILLLSACSTSSEYRSSGDILNVQHDILVFGEYHGTKEIPKFFSDFVRSKFKYESELTVGLELPYRFNQVLDYFETLNYLPSETEIRNRFSDDTFWCEFRDGRHSSAMLDLLVELTYLKYNLGQNKSLNIINLVTDKNVDVEGARIFTDAMKQQPKSVGVVLIGNYHARQTQMASYPDGPLPFSGVLSENGFEVVSLNIGTINGSMWGCAPDCHEMKVVPSAQNSLEGIHLIDDYKFFPNDNVGAFQGEFVISSLSVDTVPTDIKNVCLE